MRNLVVMTSLALLCTALNCTEHIISPNVQGQIWLTKVYNCDLTFSFSPPPRKIRVRNNNRELVWVVIEVERGGTLFNTYITSNDSKELETYFDYGDKVVIKVRFFSASAVGFDPPPNPSFTQFLQSLGGLLPVDSKEYRFTIGQPQ